MLPPQSSPTADFDAVLDSFVRTKLVAFASALAVQLLTFSLGRWCELFGPCRRSPHELVPSSALNESAEQRVYSSPMMA